MISSDPNYIERNAKRYRVIAAGEKSYICECFTQQGTWQKTTFAFCKNAVEYGSFDAAIADRNAQNLDGSKNERAPINAQQQEPPKQGFEVVVIPDSEYASRPWRK